jgi:hypothetical protein
MAISLKEVKSLFSYQEDGNLIRLSTGKLAICSPSKNHRYLRISINSKPYLLHRIIFLLNYGYSPKGIDHIDGNCLNNKIENLREANQSQNSFNRKLHSNNRSGIKNVHWHDKAQKWCVSMSIDRKRKIIGYFEDIELADLVAYDHRAKHHKEFARSK